MKNFIKVSKGYSLQLFAGLNTNVSTSTSSGNDVSAEMKEFYGTALLRLAEPALVYTQFGKETPMPKNNGKVVSWRIFDSYEKATTPLTEGVTPDGTKVNIRELTAEVSQYGAYTAISDVFQLTAVDPILNEVTNAHAAQASRTLDTVCRNQIMSGTNVFYCPNGATAATKRSDITKANLMTPDVVARVAALLKKNNAPTIDGDYVAVIHPFVAYDLMRHTEWIDANKYENSKAIFEGEIGKLYNVRFVQTSEAKIWDSVVSEVTNKVFGSIFMGADAYGKVKLDGGNLQMIIKALGSGGTSDPLDQRGTAGWKAIAVSKILIPEYLIRVESGSAMGDMAEAN